MEMFHDDEKIIQENNKQIKNENNRPLPLLFSVIFLMIMGKMKLKVASSKEEEFFCLTDCPKLPKCSVYEQRILTI